MAALANIGGNGWEWLIIFLLAYAGKHAKHLHFRCSPRNWAGNCRTFLEAGWQVGAYDISPVEYSHPQLITGFLDITDPDSWATALAEFTTHSTNDTIDVVVNNAGVLQAGALADISPTAVETQISVNCTGVALGAQAAFPHLRAGSTMVNLGSASAIFGQPNIAVYSATKFFVTGITEALSLEWAKNRIRIVAI